MDKSTRKQFLKEKQAKQLWAKYAIGNENEFWAQYEALLGQKVEAMQVEKEVALIDNKEQKCHYYFEQQFSEHLIFIAIAVFLWHRLIAFSQASYANFLGGFMLFVVSFIFTAIPLFRVINAKFSYFAIADSGLYYRGGMLDKTQYFSWEHIKHLNLREGVVLSRGKAYSTYTLYIDKFDGSKPAELRYLLSDLTSHLFMQAIENKGVLCIDG